MEFSGQFPHTGRRRVWIIVFVTVALVGAGVLLVSGVAHAATNTFYGVLSYAGHPYEDHGVWIEEGASVTARLDCGPPKPGTLDPYLEVYDPDGVLLTPVELTGSASYDDGIGDGQCGGYSGGIYAFVAAKTGAYVFRATSYDYMDGGNYGTGDGPYTLTVYGGAEGFSPGDDRINRASQDAAAPVAIYQRDGGIEVYAIDPATGEGMFALRVTADEIAALGVPTGANGMLAVVTHPFTGAEIQVWRLTTGEYQLNTANFDGSPYVVVWDEAGELYHLP